MSQSKIEQQYTKPELRERLKEELLAGDRGGRPGEWSARKAQLLAQEYERLGGGYAAEEKGPGAQSLDRWTEQAWQTRDESARVEHGGKQNRYLPRDNRESPYASRGKDAAERHHDPPHADIKLPDSPSPLGNRTGSAADRSLVDWTRDELYELAQKLGISGRSKMRKQDLLEAITRRTDDPDDRKQFP